MKISLFPFIAAIGLATCSALAQGTSIFDQQSSTDESGLVGGVLFQTVQPFGESFKPALSGIDFVRLYMDPGGPTRPDATVYVNLLSGSISGTVLASTSPLSAAQHLFWLHELFLSHDRHAHTRDDLLSTAGRIGWKSLHRHRCRIPLS
jgi:hypothetical protein